jgi:hypothetical protein
VGDEQLFGLHEVDQQLQGGHVGPVGQAGCCRRRPGPRLAGLGRPEVVTTRAPPYRFLRRADVGPAADATSLSYANPASL